jgi:hypothetical protein
MMSDTPTPDGAKKRMSDEAFDDAKRKVLFGAGYGRPPKEHQFQKGQSGNPKGRPKAKALPMQTALSSALLKEGDRVVKLNESGTSSDISMLEAVVRSVGHSAVKGNAYAARTFLQHFDRAEAERKAIIAQDVAWWTDMAQKLRDLHELYRAQGKPPPDILPHPDDIVIDPAKGVRFIGPTTREELARMEDTLAHRDMLIIQHAWEVKHGRGEGQARATSPLLIAMVLERAVPQRHRLDTVALVMRLDRWERTSKRELRKTLFRGWKALGKPWKADDPCASVATATGRLRDLISAIEQIMDEQS